jgi:hypothetical protein
VPEPILLAIKKDLVVPEMMPLEQVRRADFDHR